MHNSEDTISPKIPTLHNQPTEVRNGENSERKKESKLGQPDNIVHVPNLRRYCIVNHKVIEIVPKKTAGVQMSCDTVQFGSEEAPTSAYE